VKPADQPDAVPYTAEGCYALPVVRVHLSEGPALVTAWELSEQEMADVQRTGRIWVTLLGNLQPPIMVTSRSVHAPDPLDEELNAASR
jgi:hypothetical protein